MDATQNISTPQQETPKLLREADASDEPDILAALHQLTQTFRNLEARTHLNMFPGDQCKANQNDHHDAFRSLMATQTKRNALCKVGQDIRDLWELAMNEKHNEDDIFQLLRCVGPAIEQLDALAVVQRKHFRASLRGQARPLTISDIPDELLMWIFAYVRNWRDPAKLWLQSDKQLANHDFRSIKRVRLTCRRFCDASSHLLLHCVDVTLHKDSLAKLDRISRHPKLSRGVRAVCVHLDSLSARLAVDHLAFAARVGAELGLELMHYDSTAHTYRVDESLSVDVTGDTSAALVEKARWIHQTWVEYLRSAGSSPLLDDGDIDGSAIAIAAVRSLRAAHRDYIQRHSDQQRLLKDGHFTQSVSEAIARMPTAVGLILAAGQHDIGLCKWPPTGQYLESKLRDLPLFIRNKTWRIEEHESDVEVITRSAPLLSEIPTAVHQAGVQLRHLEITLPSRYIDRWEPNEHDRNSLLALGKTLRTLFYRGPPELPGPRGNNICDYLVPLMSGDNLDILAVQIRSEDSETKEIGPLLAANSPHANLRKMTIAHCSLKLDELEALCRRFQTQGLCLKLWNVHLISGSWAEALDLLRETADCGSELWRPTGAECDHLSREDYARLFTRRIRSESLAMQYILRSDSIARNPLIPEPEDEPQIEEA